MTRHLSHNETLYSVGAFATINDLKAFNVSGIATGNTWAYVNTEGEYYFVPSDISTPESLPSVVVPNAGNGRWFKKALTSVSNYSLVKLLSIGGGGGGTAKSKVFYNFSMAAQASATPGLLTKAATNVNNLQGALPTTSPYDMGINNGAIDPYVIPFAGKVKSLRVTLAQSAIAGGGPVSSSVTVRFDLYKMGYSTRTLLASYDIPLDSTKVNVFNNLATDGFQSAVLGNLSTQLTAGDVIGIQFTNRATGNDVISSAGRVYAALEVLED